ncbi:hypothetical protein L6452_28531 [Arctium lappa]|uniref:Uncharacterized protein n=1 Tax=Arctium lappa TaxID=4217 RepID=A0ACB8ZXT0_ARCLA|nr:hypothetical protein L6452_28531 [Arctium lappa]
MDPYYEQRLRDEVIYLHSLWHQGPLSRSLPYTNLQPCNSTNFKKKKSKSNARQPKKVGSFSGKEWPVKPLPADPPVTQSGWPELKLKPKPQQETRLLTPEDLEKYNWNQIQQRSLKAAKDFFARNGEDSDEDDDIDDMDEDDEDDVKDEEYDFFSKLLNEDEELKCYYVKHCGGGGEFSCLVCGGANEKYRKRFNDCIALVQHSTSIAKTKKLRSHRAYGQVICKVLGWDIDRLPSSIVADYKGNSNDVNADKDVNDGANNAGLNKIIDNGESNLQVDPNGNGHDVSETVDGESMVCEDLPVVANVEEENTKKQILNEAEGSAGGAITNLCRNLSSTMVLEPPPPSPVAVQLQTN